MTYREEKRIKVEVAVKYAEEGFRNSLIDAANELATLPIDQAPDLLARLLAEYEVVTETREERDRTITWLDAQEEE